MKKYIVSIRRYVTEETSVEIIAENEEEAQEKAEEIYDSGEINNDFEEIESEVDFFVKEEKTKKKGYIETYLPFVKLHIERGTTMLFENVCDAVKYAKENNIEIEN